MVSAWWLLVAFAGGGFAGVLLMALMYIAGAAQEHSPAYSVTTADPGGTAGG